MKFAYIRVSTKSQTTDSQVTDIKKSYPSIETYTDVCSGTIPALERPQLSRLLDKLRKGDVLVVWWIDRLGRNYQDSETTIRDLLNRGVVIKTINQNMTFAYSGNDMLDMTTNIQLTMITAMAAAERKNRLASAEAGRQAIKKDPQVWSEKFSGRKANQELHGKIIELLEDGLSIRKIAERLNCNASTVQRVKKNL